MSTQRRIQRLFSFAFGSLAMLAVLILSAFITMRLAIHGREVEVPALSGLTVAQARQRASSKGLSINVENHFYSTVVPAGHILSQLPAPGETVRRDWQVRVSESLGAQRVSIPDVTGQSERSATIALRRLSLDLGPVAHLPTDGTPDTILAQTPPPNAEAVTGPRVSLLVSQPDDSRADDAFVMPSLTGLSFYAATARAAAAGLHIIQAPDAATPAPASASPNPASPNPDAMIVGDTQPPANSADPTEPPQPSGPPTGNVVSQYPIAGHRVLRGAGVHLGFAHPEIPSPPTDIPTTPTTP